MRAGQNTARSALAGEQTEYRTCICPQPRERARGFVEHDFSATTRNRHELSWPGDTRRSIGATIAPSQCMFGHGRWTRSSFSRYAQSHGLVRGLRLLEMLVLRKVIGPVVAMGACALFWGESLMAAAGTSDAPPSKAVIAVPAAAVIPSIEILPSQSQLAGTCG